MLKTLSVSVIVLLFLSACASASNAQKEPQQVVTPQWSQDGNAATPPNLISAWFDGPAKWNSLRERYKNRLFLKYEATAAPLFLHVKVRWRNQNGEGVTLNPTIDISQWATGGTIYRNWTFGLAGEYTFTVTIRNIAGESSLTLPTLIVR